MLPEEKEELKILIKETLKESSEEVVSPIVKVIQVYKDVDLEEGTDKVIADSKLDQAETVKVSRMIKWSSVQDIIETTKTDQNLFEVKKLYKLILHNGSIYCEIKNIKEFENAWEEAILAYGFV